MILNMSGGASGASLNFDVKAYASEAALPATAKENTIAVITDTAITSYIFSETEPESPAEGMVWFSVGTSSSVAFSATKKNPVMVYPLSAKQYVGGAWVDVEAKTYQGGAWVDWAFHLLSDGVFASGYEFESYSKGTVVQTDGAVIFKVTTTDFATLFCKQQVDVTNYKTAKIAVSGGSANQAIYFGFASTKKALSSSVGATSVFDKAYTSFTPANKAITATENAIDLTSLTGKLWFGCTITGSGQVSSTNYGNGGISAVDITFE